LLVEVFVELGALDDGGVGFGELVAVKVDEDGLDVVDQLLDPAEVEEGSVDGLSLSLALAPEPVPGEKRRHTTKITPSSLTNVHRSVCWSCL